MSLTGITGPRGSSHTGTLAMIDLQPSRYVDGDIPGGSQRKTASWKKHAIACVSKRLRREPPARSGSPRPAWRRCGAVVRRPCVERCRDGAISTFVRPEHDEISDLALGLEQSGRSRRAPAGAEKCVDLVDKPKLVADERKLVVALQFHVAGIRDTRGEMSPMVDGHHPIRRSVQDERRYGHASQFVAHVR